MQRMLAPFTKPKKTSLTLSANFVPPVRGAARRGDLCLWMMPEGAKADALAEAGVELHSADDAYLQGGDRSKPDPWWPSGTKNSLKPSPTITPACAPAATHAGCNSAIGRPSWSMRII